MSIFKKKTNVPQFKGDGTDGCEYCGNTFSSQEAVRDHKNKSHNFGFKPEKKSFAPAKSLKKSKGAAETTAKNICSTLGKGKTVAPASETTVENIRSTKGKGKTVAPAVTEWIAVDILSNGASTSQTKEDSQKDASKGKIKAFASSSNSKGKDKKV